MTTEPCWIETTPRNLYSRAARNADLPVPGAPAYKRRPQVWGPVPRLRRPGPRDSTDRGDAPGNWVGWIMRDGPLAAGAAPEKAREHEASTSR